MRVEAVTSEPTPLQKAAIRYAALRTQLEQAQQEIRRFEEAIREHNEHCPEYEEGIEHIEGIPVR